MKHTARIPLSVLALMLAASAFANTPAENVAWSVKPVKTVASSSFACSAYSGRVMSSGESLSTEGVLKALGTSLAGAALGAVAGGYQGAAPNPCPRPGL
jgi:outer membrane lipoprotein SlyB